MYEVELKVRADHDAVRDRLADHDADRAAVVRQVDTYYDAPDRSFAETDEALRIRREGPAEAPVSAPPLDATPSPDAVVELTYKGPKVDDSSKTRVEHETTVGDGPATDRLLQGLGYDPAATVAKARERYTLPAGTVTLDAVAGLGTFVEVETEVADEGAVADARDRLRALLRDIDLDPDAGIRTSYLGLRLGTDD